MDRPVSFPNWKATLAQAPLSEELKATYAREILSFLKQCKDGRVAATVAVALIKQWLAGRETAANGPAHDALRWFYKTAPKAESDDDGNGDSPAGGAERSPCFIEDAAKPAAGPAGPPGEGMKSASGDRAPPDGGKRLGDKPLHLGFRNISSKAGRAMA